MGGIRQGGEETVGVAGPRAGGGNRSRPNRSVVVAQQPIKRLIGRAATESSERMQRRDPLTRSFREEPVYLGLPALDVLGMHRVLADQGLGGRRPHRGLGVIESCEQGIARVVAWRVGE